MPCDVRRGMYSGCRKRCGDARIGKTAWLGKRKLQLRIYHFGLSADVTIEMMNRKIVDRGGFLDKKKLEELNDDQLEQVTGARWA